MELPPIPKLVFHLFDTAYIRMHEANPNILVSNDAATYKKFVDYWLSHQGKLDYISFHKYDCDGTHMGDELPLWRAENRHFAPLTDGIWYGVNTIRELWYDEYGTTLPAIMTEGNFAAVSGDGTDPRIQEVVGAVWNALNLRSFILNDIQYAIYYSFGSSANWELQKPSGGVGFGMINLDNNSPWYPYYVQKMIGENLGIGDQLLDSSSSSDEIRALSWVNNDKINILLISKVDQPRSIVLHGLEGQASYTKIDDSVSYLTPQLQTGTMDLTQPMNTIGYSVILLQILP